MGYFICAKNPGVNFTDSEKRTLSHVAPMIAGMLHEIQRSDDAKAIGFLRESK